MNLIRRFFQSIRKNSTGSEFARRRINLIEGSNVTLTVADDSANDEVDVTIAASGGGTPSIGGGITGGTQYSVLFVDPAGTIAEDNTNFNYNNSLDALSVGQPAAQVNVNSIAVTPKLTVDMETDLIGELVHVHNSSTSIAANVVLAKSAGTHASPTIVTTSDTLGIIGAYGYTGNSGVGYQKASQIRFETPSTGTISTTSMPGQISIYNTADGSVTPSLTSKFYRESSIGVERTEGIQSAKGLYIDGLTAPISNEPFSLLSDAAGTNLITNPSFEVDTSGWSALGANATITRVTTPWIGDYGCRVVISPAAISQGIQTSSITVSANTRYMFSVYVKGDVGAEGIVLVMTGNVSGDTNGVVQSLSTGWRRFTVAKTMGASDTSVICKVITSNATAPTFYIDAAQLEQTTSDWPSSYMDGSMSQLALGYSWSGTAHASTSTRAAGVRTFSNLSAGAFPFVIKPNGTIGGSSIKFDLDVGQLGDSMFPFTVTSHKPTANNIGFSEATANIKNTADGCALWVTSNSLSQFGAVIETPNLTSGACLAFFVPSDLSNVTGSFLRFASKDNTDMYKWNRDYYQMGNPSQSYNKYGLYYAGGAWGSNNDASALLTGTVSTSGATLTGSGTSFTTELQVGDIIVYTGSTTVSVIQAIASNTSATLSATPGAAIPGGTTFKRIRGNRYSPSIFFLEGPNLDHKSLGKADSLYGFFISKGGTLRVKGPTFTTGSGTLSATSGGTTFTTSVANAGIQTGYRIHATGHAPFIVQKVNSTTSFEARTTFASTLTTVGFEYEVTGSATYPSSDTDGMRVLNSHYKETSSAGPSATTSETSLFTTKPVIRADQFGTTGVYRLRILGTITTSGSGRVLTLRVKLGAKGSSLTTILTPNTETINNHGSDIPYTITVTIANNAATNSQRVFLEFFSKTQADGGTTEQIYAVGTSSIDTTFDTEVDVTAQFGTAATMAGLIKEGHFS